MNKQERHEQNEKHATTPEPGDYWSEMLCGACVVLKVTDTTVIYCTTKKSMDTDHWMWDLNVLQLKTREDFKVWLQYSGTNTRYWCDVNPGAHGWACHGVDYKKAKVLAPVNKVEAPAAQSTFKWTTFEELKEEIESRDGWQFGDREAIWKTLFEEARA